MKSKNTGLIIRSNKRENPYVLIDKSGLNDERLSWKAKGLLAYLLSKPDDWSIYVTDLVKRSKDGEDSVRAGLKELQDTGYMSVTRIRDEKGIFKGIEYVVYEQPLQVEHPHRDFPEMDEKHPHRDFPDVGFPELDKPNLENPALVINDFTNNLKKEIDRLIDADAIKFYLNSLPANLKLEHVESIRTLYNLHKDHECFSDAIFVQKIDAVLKSYKNNFFSCLNKAIETELTALKVKKEVAQAKQQAAVTSSPAAEPKRKKTQQAKPKLNMVENKSSATGWTNEERAAARARAAALESN